MDPAPPLWRIALQVPEPALDAVMAALDRYCRSVSWFEADGGGWSVEALADWEPDRPSLDVAVAVAAASVGMEPPHVHMARLPATDWLAANRQDFPPIRVGRFFVYGSHIAEPAPAGSIGLRIDAATAFGSGHHGTTAGCLMAIDDLVQQKGQSRVKRVLDLGCGSGLLAIAMAKAWPAPVVAADIDPVAVAVAADNARRNGVAARIHTVCADGFAAAAVRCSAPYDVVAANILARPLCRLADGVTRHLAPGGHLILSGFVPADGQRVLSAYSCRGLILVRRITRADWQTLVLRKPLRTDALQRTASS